MALKITVNLDGPRDEQLRFAQILNGGVSIARDDAVAEAWAEARVMEAQRDEALATLRRDSDAARNLDDTVLSLIGERDRLQVDFDQAAAECVTLEAERHKFRGLLAAADRAAVESLAELAQDADARLALTRASIEQAREVSRREIGRLTRERDDAHNTATVAASRAVELSQEAAALRAETAALTPPPDTEAIPQWLAGVLSRVYPYAEVFAGPRAARETAGERGAGCPIRLVATTVYVGLFAEGGAK